MRIIIADDHALFRDGLKLNLEKLAPMASFVEASDFSQVFQALSSSTPADIIIIDLNMPDMLWQTALPKIRGLSPTSKIVVLSGNIDNFSIKKALELGANGYLLKNMESKVINSALKLILDGGIYLPSSMLDSNNKSEASKHSLTNGKHLTPRQSEVLDYVSQGLSNKQIAYEMGVSEATVKLHINALLRAVGATNRTQAVIFAQKQGII